MKAPVCPHCGHKLPHLRFKYVADKAIRRVLKVAKKPTHISTLASEYAAITGASYRAGRKAIERLVSYGQLKRIVPGIYQTLT